MGFSAVVKMPASKAQLLLVLISFGVISNAFQSPLPSGKELIYDYHAQVQVGTHKPTSSASQFKLEGKLHIQNIDDAVLVKFSDLSYKLYNGELNHRDEYTSLPLNMPEQTADLMKPFRIVYNSAGKVEFITTEKEDREFSRNIKKSLASIFQIDLEHLNLDKKQTYTFTTTENSIYGSLKVRYNVQPDKTGVVVEKILDVKNTENKYSYISDEEQLSYKLDRSPVTITSHRLYTIVQHEDNYKITHIEALGGIYLHVLKEFSDTQFMVVNQTLNLLDTIPIKNQFIINSPKLDDPLTIKVKYDPKSETLPDLSFGRSEMSTEMYEKLVYKKLKQVVEYLELNHLPMERPDFKRGQAVIRLHELMGMLDLAALKRMFSELEKKTDAMDKKIFAIFQEMIPLIGTRASTIFIRNLIKERKISDKMAISFMQKMPFNLRTPSKELLIEVEDMLGMENVSKNVKETALFTFASLINKVYKHENMTLENEQQDLQKDDLLERYIVRVLNMLKATEDYSEQFLYINTLFNIKVGNVYKYMEPYIKGEATSNRHLRFLAMHTTYTEGKNRPDWLYDVYWPILTDRSQHIELRGTAYIILMDRLRDTNILWDLYWFMRSEPSAELYHLHYTYITSVVHCVHSTFDIYRKSAAQILNYMRKPWGHPLSGLYWMDYKDPKYGFWALSALYIFSTNKSISLYHDYTYNTYNIPLRYFGFWIKIDGVTNITDLKESSLLANKDIRVEYAIFHHDQIIQMGQLNHTNIKNFQFDWSILFGNPLGISNDFQTQLLIPNDLGLPTAIQAILPTISNRNLSLTVDNIHGTSVTNGDLKLQRASHLTYEMQFYNPIPDIWQGIRRIQAFDMMTNLNYKISLFMPLNLKVKINGYEDDSRDIFTWRNYATSVTTVQGDTDNLLQQSSNHSQHYVVVSNGEENKTVTPLLEHDMAHTGLKLETAIFDTKHVSRSTLMELIESVTQTYFKNYQTMPSGQILTTMINAIDYLMLLPRVGTSGFIIKVTPSKKYQVDHVDFGFSISQRENLENKLPIKKIDYHAIISTKDKDDKMISKFDTNVMLDMKEGRTNNFKIKSSILTPDNDKEFGMCIDVQKKWWDTKVTANMSIKYGFTSDPKSCSDSEGLIEVAAKGDVSKEQLIDTKTSYASCAPSYMPDPLLKDFSINYRNNIGCLKELTSIRRYEYDVKTTKLSNNIKKSYQTLLQQLKYMFYPYYSSEEVSNPMDDDAIKVTIEFPVNGEEVNWHVMTKDKTMNVTEAPRKWWSMLGIHPVSYHFTEAALWLNDLGLTESCVVNTGTILSDNYEIFKISSSQWVEVATSERLTISVKQLGNDNDLAVRIKLEDDLLEISPSGDDYKIEFNKQLLAIDKSSYHHENRFSLGVLIDKYHTMILHMYDNLYISYDGKTLVLDKIKLDLQLSGICFTN